jgi:hypothetical protein
MSPVAFHIAILRAAALLVPEPRRTDWLAEWLSELWHIRRDSPGINVTAFCMGAFPDAFWLRRNESGFSSLSLLQLDVPPTPTGIESFPDQGTAALASPVRCLAWLAILGMLCLAIGLLLPAARPVLLSMLYPRDLVLLSPLNEGDVIADANGFFDPRPSISWEQFQWLKAHDDGEFSDLRYYETTGLSAGRQRHGAPALRWTEDLSVLPASVKTRLVRDDAAPNALPPGTKGFVLARLRHGNVRNSHYHFIRVSDRPFRTLGMVLPAFLFAGLLLRIMNAGSPECHLRRISARRSLFLAAKTLLMALIVAVGSLDLTSFGHSVSPLFLHVLAFGSLFAVRWIVADQRNRCPVCLRLLAHPVRIGGSSRILLEWHGTEFMCDRGHGMLYVPEWPAIWSARQRWMELGASWGGLFLG